MIFKGIRFRRNRSIVPMKGLATTVDGKVQDSGYVRFGHVCKPTDKGAEETGVRRSVEGGGMEPVYAKPVLVTGFSRTNMAYGLDGRVYMMYDAACYTASKPKPKAKPL